MAFKPYTDLGGIVQEMIPALRPPERLTVAEAAEKYRYLNIPGAYIGPWRNKTVPYLVEPMNALADRELNAEVFVGPAQCGKTELILNWAGYVIRCNPADFILYQTSQGTARDFSRRRLDRMHRHSKEIGSELLTSGSHNDNTFDKFYKSGMMLTLSWPSINEMSGRPIGCVSLTDYDRMPENVDDEGAPFDLARKRTTTFGSFAMTLAESSPGFSIEDHKWIRSTPHEAPPCKGILALYNRGDRRRWVWPCVHCGEFFEPSFSTLTWIDKGDIFSTAETVQMACPHCHSLIHSDHKFKMNQAGVWLREGQKINAHGHVTGAGLRSDIASFWLKGPAAAFATWQKLVLNYLKAQEEYEKTGSEEALKSTVNTDQGEAYTPRGLESLRSADDIKGSAVSWPEKTIPRGVRFLVATIDVQKNRWEVQVHGVGVGGDVWEIDRFPIVKSNRKDEDGERLWVKPATYAEDWDLLIPEVIDKEYELEDGSGTMSIKLTICDSGGRAGVTTKAYDFWRKLRDDTEGKSRHTRFLLLKGEPNLKAPRAAINYPDSQRKDRTAGARGEVPVLFLNVDVLKDQLNGMLDRTDPGGGRVTFPDWLPDEFFNELTAERRTPKGWVNPRKSRNESWDLLTYLLGALAYLKVDTWDWTNPPRWAEDWETNILVTKRTPEGAVVQSEKTTYGSVKRAAELLA